MPGAPDRETPLPVRRFQGTMLAMDPAFTPPGFLTRSENWVPDLTYVLSKRRGSLSWLRLPQPGRCDPLVYTTATDGHRYLYAVAADQLYMSKDDSPFSVVSNGVFPLTRDARATGTDNHYGAAVVAASGADGKRATRSRAACGQARNSNSNPDARSRAGTTRRLFSRSSVSVRRTNAPASSIHEAAGRPTRTPPSARPPRPRSTTASRPRSTC